MAKPLLSFICAVSALALSACGDSGQRLMENSLMGQMTALCRSSEFLEFDQFPATARRLRVVSDEGPVEPDYAMDAQLVASDWIASDSLGSRSTIWRGSYGAGEFNYRLTVFVDAPSLSDANATGSQYETEAFERAEVCVADGPSLSRQEGMRMVRDYGLLANDFWRVTRDAEGRAVPLSYRRVLVSEPDFWREIEFVLPAPGETGVTIIRRHFYRPS